MVVEVVDILGAAYGRVLKKAKEGYFWNRRIGNSWSVYPATCGDEGSPHSGSDHPPSTTVVYRGLSRDAGSASIGLPPLFFNPSTWLLQNWSRNNKIIIFHCIDWICNLNYSLRVDGLLFNAMVQHCRMGVSRGRSGLR